MKLNKRGFNGIVAAALLGAVIPLASAMDESPSFTPIEKLDPSSRMAFESQLNLLMKDANIDWSSVIAGMNQKGELVIKGIDKNATKVANPSCWASHR